jgi:hypothetical protein
VPCSYILDSQLGNWVYYQRDCFRKGKLDPEKKNRLDEIGFDFNPGKEREKDWNFEFDKLRQFKNDHGHCELVWAVDRFTLILNTPTNTPTVSIPELQAMCQGCTRKTRNWADGSTSSVQSSKLAKWTWNEKKGSTKLISISNSRILYTTTLQWRGAKPTMTGSTHKVSTSTAAAAVAASPSFQWVYGNGTTENFTLQQPDFHVAEE